MFYVVGSGPAGVSCASALLEKGLEVTMIDAGVDLELARRRAVERLGALPPEKWDHHDLSTIRENNDPRGGGIPTKHVYGSDFPYREVDRLISLERRNVGAGPSLARGGFSNVWGAVAAPYHPEDMAEWPVSARDLAPHYKSVLRLMELSAEDDGLALQFPLYTQRPALLQGSRQAEAFLADCRASREALETAGIYVGRSRLAVRATPSQSDRGCVYCGLCLYGCPYGLIYNAQSTLRRQQVNRGFRYRTDIVVRRLEEKPGQVRIHGVQRNDGTPVRIDAERVYLASGVFSTTKILLESLGTYDEPVTIRDSQYFLLPLLRYRRTSDVQTESLHTLAQALIEIRDPSITSGTIHMEVFTYNDMLSKLAEARLGRLAPLFRLAIGEFVRRLIILQCFLHSDVSATISARLLRSKAKDSGTLLLEGMPNRESRKIVGRVWRKLMAHHSHLRAVPVPPLIEIAEPGRSYHSGGSFPMRSIPNRFESDVWGRPSGMKRVHAVDATVFPTLPATTITLPVMANAHRIGSGYDET